MRQTHALLPALAFATAAILGASGAVAQSIEGTDRLAGAWRGKVQFTTGAFAEAKDLEFMYAFAADGTLTESSNYDAAPPVPPAYGVWRKLGVRSYEARYQFYQSKPVTSAGELVKSGGWVPNGYGTLTQRITLSVDGNSFKSTVDLELFDKDGKAVGGGGRATADGNRMKF